MSKEGRVGPVMPSEAASGGQLNQSTPMDQRVPDKGLPLSEGPQVGANGEFKPAKYEVERGGFKFLIEDR